MQNRQENFAIPDPICDAKSILVLDVGVCPPLPLLSIESATTRSIRRSTDSQSRFFVILTPLKNPIAEALKNRNERLDFRFKSADLIPSGRFLKYLKMSNSMLPELQTEILSLLPVKSLIRFSSASKSWCSLISSPNFITLHLNKTTAKNKGLLLFRYAPKSPYLSWLKDLYFLYADEYLPQNCIEKLVPPYRAGSSIEILGSCNGVVCLKNFFSHSGRFYLWNPGIRKTLVVPSHNISYAVLLGFGFDSITNDYKIVAICHVFVKVYSMRKGFWSKIDCTLDYINAGNTQSVFLNGACHWIVYTSKSAHSSFEIVVFDLENELLRKMAVPDCLINAYKRTMNVTIKVLDGLLLLVLLERLGDGESSVWVMKEYGVVESWTRLYNFYSSSLSMEKVIAVRSHGDILYANNRGKLVCYDPNTTNINESKFRGLISSFYLESYVESLVLFKEGKGILQKRSSSGSDADKKSLKKKKKKGMEQMVSADLQNEERGPIVNVKEGEDGQN